MPSVEDLEGAGVLTAAAYHPTGPGEVEPALTCAGGMPQARLTRSIRPTLRMAVAVFKTAMAASDTR